MLCDYRTIVLGKSDQAGAEGPRVYQAITERHVQATWLEQRYFRALVAASGEPIEVVSAGMWNAEAGPDFLKAHVRIGGMDYLGDIEIHLSDEGWLQHGHHQDPRYNNVILHVSFWPSRSGQELRRQDGVHVARAYLEPHLTIPVARLVKLIDLDLYPYKKFVGSGRCAQALFRSMPKEEMMALFSTAALRRLEQKALFLETRIADRQLRCSAGVAMALGYRGNTIAFLEIFQWLQAHRHRDEKQLFAMALGASGFFGELYRQRWGQSSYYRELATLWSILQPLMDNKTFSVVVSKQRPFNHPVRRLALLIKVIQDPRWSTFLELTQMLLENSTGEARRWMEQYEEHFPVYEDAYWSSHYLFEAEAKTTTLPLMGQELKQAVLVNTIFPLLSKIAHGPELLAIFRALRGHSSGKRRYLAHRFFGDTSKTTLLRQAMYEQGAFQIHKDFCVHYEASCEGCPFVALVQQNSITDSNQRLTRLQESAL